MAARCQMVGTMALAGRLLQEPGHRETLLSRRQDVYKRQTEVQRRLMAEGFKARLLLQVHDELDFSVPEGAVCGCLLYTSRCV